MQRGTESRRIGSAASPEDIIRRAAAEHLKRVGGTPESDKPSGVPYQSRPKLRGAPAAAAVIGRAGVDPPDDSVILYLDTSALVKLYVEEEGSNEVRNAVEDAASAASVAASAVAYPEARSAFARLKCDSHLSTEQHQTIVAQLDEE